MKNIIILDIYRNTDYRISKDTSGGYGTANDFGNSFFSKILKKKMKSKSDWPPLFAAYTYAVLKKKYSVSYKKIYNNSNIEKYLKNIDYYIIVSSIVCSDIELQLIEKLKRENKNIISIGPYASTCSENYLKAGSAVIKGEPELFFLKNNIEDITDIKEYINDHQIDINSLPYPPWNELIKFDDIKLYGKHKSIPILGTRGCPYSCFKYCVYPLQQGRKVRQRTPQNIFNEIMYWKKKWDVTLFIFRDPVFSINRNHTLELCNLIIQNNIKIHFVIETHLRILDDELILNLKKAGLIFVKVGIESSDSEILKKEMRYSVTNDEQLEKIKKLHENKINVSAMYILGYPSDTNETILNTINYSKLLNTAYAQFSIWTPYPGTPAYKEYETKIITDEFSDFSQYQLVYKHKNFNKKQLKNLLEVAYKKYYLRLSWIFRYGFKLY